MVSSVSVIAKNGGGDPLDLSNINFEDLSNFMVASTFSSKDEL